MINILCYGDSNTNGTNPSGGRWPRNIRWTGVLQERLGSNFYIIEEGCGGRTTVMEDFLEPDKNGRTFLPVALRTHRPLDMVIIMLGTNDMKQRFNLLPVDIAYGAAELGKLTERFDYGPEFPIPKVLLISPIELGEGVENSVFSGFSSSAVSVSKQLANFYQKQAEAHNWLYLNAAAIASPSSRDMLHMEKEDHLALAIELEKIIKNYFKEE